MRWAVAFVALMLAGLTLRSLAPSGGGPADDPVNGARTLSPLQQAIADHREEWRAELERGQAETPRGEYNRAATRLLDEWDAAWPRPSWELRARMRVWREWMDEDPRHGLGQGPRP